MDIVACLLICCDDDIIETFVMNYSKLYFIHLINQLFAYLKIYFLSADS